MINVNDEVSIVKNPQYTGHWGVVKRIDGAGYHVTGGSIGDIAPVFNIGELRKKNFKRFKVSELSETRKFSGVITLDDLRRKFNIPAGADVFIKVPSGGDWSNTNLDLSEVMIQVEWEEVK